MNAKFIRHLTLNTGHSRDSPREEVGEDIIDTCRDLIVGCLASHLYEPIPAARDPDCVLVATREGRCLVATVSALFVADHGELAGELRRIPLVTIGVAESARCGATLWRALHAGREPGLQTDRNHPPQAPWCAARLEPSISYQLFAGAAHWLGDFERCLAWAWIDYLGENNAHPR